MNTYTFTYYGWIPGYDDFDQDWIDVKANTLEEALTKLNKMKLFIKVGPELVGFNGTEIKDLTPGTEII